MRTPLTWAVLLLGINPAGAETLHSEDGVRLSATLQEIDPGAAICRIREERHSAEEYAKLRPNDGQPLDVWRIELLVANYSGKTLDYLNVHVNARSDWPPCDHWDGPEASYGKPVVWTGPLMPIQDWPVEPGEEVRETAFVLAYHEDEPTFGRWDINYTFAAEGGVAPAAPGAERPARPPRDAQGERTRGLFEPEETCAGKQVGASCWQELANQPGCYLWNPGLARGSRVTWAGDCSGGLASGISQRTWNYTDEDGEPTSETAAGELRKGKSHGHWTIRLANGLVVEGPFVDGKEHGHFVLRAEDGDIYEGPFVDGKRSGLWVLRLKDGLDEVISVWEGPYVDGKMNGHWVERDTAGDVEQGPYVNGEKHGQWTTRDTDGEVWRQGRYVNGKRHGRWTFTWGDECYSNGEEVNC